MKNARRGSVRQPGHTSQTGAPAISEQIRRYRNHKGSSPHLQPHHYLLVVGGVLGVGVGAVSYALWRSRELAAKRGIDPEALMSVADVRNALVGIVAISSMLAWAMLFFDQIRPRLAGWIGAGLNVTIVEGRRLHWRVERTTSFGVRLLVSLVDLVILLLATTVPLLPILLLIFKDRS